MLKFVHPVVFFFLTLLLSVGVALGDPSHVSDARKDTLIIWTINNGSSAQSSLKRILRNFQKESGIQVRMTVLDWGDAFERINKALLDTTFTEEKPDVVQLGSTWIAYFASKGGIRPLNSLSKKADFGRFLPVALKNAHPEGSPNVYAAPWFLDVRGLFANERLWSKLNVDRIDVDTIPAFLGTLRAIGKSNLRNGVGRKVVPFALPSHEDWTGPQQMALFVWSYGGDFVVRDSSGLRSGILDSAFLKGFAVYAALMSDSVAAPYSLQDNSSQSTDRFVKSEQLLVYGTLEMIRLLEFYPTEGGLRATPIADDGIVTIPFPGGPAGKAAFVGGSHLALSRKGDVRRQKQAESLLVYLLRADNIDAFSRKIGFLPADQSLLRIWFKDERYSQLIRNLDQGRTFPNIAEWGEIENVLNRLANKMTEVYRRGGQPAENIRDVSELLLSTDQEINRILKAEGVQVPAERVQALLSDVPEEEVPTNLKLEYEKDSAPSREYFVIRCIIQVIISLFVLRWIVVFVLKRKRKREK